MAGARKKIGIIGGMGPEATVELQQLILREAKKLGAKRDQDFPAMLVEQNTNIPDRTRAIMGQGESPLPQLRASLSVLEKGECDFAIMPCNTAHRWIKELNDGGLIPVLNMIALVKQAIVVDGKDKADWLLLATTGTLQTELYQKQFVGNACITLHHPETESPEQIRIMDAIYHPDFGIKAGYGLDDDSALRHQFGKSPTSELHGVIIQLCQEHGCTGVILGCTELNLAVDRDFLAQQGISVVEPMQVLASVSAAIGMGRQALPSHIAEHGR